MMLPIWLVVLAGGAMGVAFLLIVVLWSTRSQRYTRIPMRGLAPPESLLPAVEGLIESWVVEGNAVEILLDGNDFYPALLEDISTAESSVHLEVFAWWRGEICVEVAAALIERARRGVEVRLLLDAIGSMRMESDVVESLRDAGCSVVFFHSFRFRTLGRMNKRDHRKLAILDGRVSYVFGHGIADEWDGRSGTQEAWRDLALRIRGPASNRLQGVFAQNWMEESSELLSHPTYFPSIRPQGSVPLQTVASSPRGGVSNSSLIYRLMIAAARRQLWIQNPYFAPGPEMASMLTAAAERGVCVRILVPGSLTDSPIVQWAGRHLFQRLLEAGVELYRSELAFCHQKVMIVDSAWSYVGSANFDERSFDINAEVGVSIPDPDFAAQLMAAVGPQFEPPHATRISLENWQRRPRLRRWGESAAYLLHDQL